ncbi:MAG: FHA domain-containing protein [Deltaproteobacteria bacterium]|nr:FHA domain-containing protein [Deltaproteobacteria bacterium]
MFEIVIFGGETPVLRCPLHGQGVSIGRSGANDIALPQEDAPAFWCSFEAQDGSYFLVDRAGDGVRVNGKMVSNAALKEGDTIHLGELEAVFHKIPSRAKLTTSAGHRTGVLVKNEAGKLLHRRPALRMPKSMSSEIIPILDGGLRIGADEDCDLHIDDGFISGFHAQLFHRGERMFVRDLDSTNGTFVDGVKVVEAQVPIGACLKTGQLEMDVISIDDEEKVVAKGDGPWSLGELVTCEQSLAKVFSLIEKVAEHDATVCIFGETGCGKELAAKALHDLSPRQSKKLVPLNCAAIPEALIESFLFGHEKGAFTGADKLKKGAFEQAHKGTLFLDEIGELPLDAQAKLLRVLESRQVQRLGSVDLIDVDVRIVCATHRDLVQHVKEGRFREDLLHRLYVIPIQLPPLRNRVNDIVYLAKVLANKINGHGGKVELTEEAAKKLQAHPFPGNVRELRNTIQRGLIFGDAKTLAAEDVVFLPTSLEEVAAAAAVYRPGMSFEDVERQAFTMALEAHKTASEAARSLGLPKATFWRRATALGLLKKEGGK